MKDSSFSGEILQLLALTLAREQSSPRTWIQAEQQSAQLPKGRGGISAVVSDKGNIVLEVIPGQTSNAKKEKAH